jgi:hypothetical protein
MLDLGLESSAAYWALVGTGFGQILGVLTAILINEYIAWRRRPRVFLTYDPDSRDNNSFLPLYKRVQPGGGEVTENAMAGNLPEGCKEKRYREELYVRLEVKNKSRQLAEDVKIWLYQIWCDGENWNVPSWWFKVSNLNLPGIDIPSRLNRNFDLFFIKNVIDEHGDIGAHLMIVPYGPLEEDWFKLKSQIEEDEERRLLSVGSKYKAIVTLTGRNIVSVAYLIEFDVLKRGGDMPREYEEQTEEHLRRRYKVGVTKLKQRELDRLLDEHKHR